MSILNFFKSNAKRLDSDNSDIKINDNGGVENMVNYDLFVDNKPPLNVSEVSQKLNPIDQYLDQNFELNGYNDGYEIPSSEYLDSKLKHLRSSFRTTIDKSIDIRRSEVGELKLHQIQTAGISDRLEAQLNERIRQIEEVVHVLDTEKILSLEDEGLISSAIHSYRIGFIQGIEKYQQEKLFINNSGLFK